MIHVRFVPEADVNFVQCITPEIEQNNFHLHVFLLSVQSRKILAY